MVSETVRRVQPELVSAADVRGQRPRQAAATLDKPRRPVQRRAGRVAVRQARHRAHRLPSLAGALTVSVSGTFVML